MRASRSILVAAVLSSVPCLSSPARADDPAAAKVLFDHGVEDLEAGRFDKACPSIEKSYKLDPRPGTLFTLAECEAKLGRVATSLRRYDEYLALYGTLSPEKKAKQGDREKVAREQAAALGARVPELTLALPPNAPAGTTVTRDGAVVDKMELGAPIRVDPGDHVVVTQGPGGPTTTVRITLTAGERRGIALLVAPPPPVVAPPPPAARPVVVVETPAPRAAAGPGWRLYTGSTLVGLGVAFAIAGAVSTAQVISANNAIQAKRSTIPAAASYDWCSSSNTPSNGLSSACAKARAFQTLEIVAYPAAAAFLGVGTYLLVTRRKSLQPAATGLVVVPALAPGFTGLDASLRF